MMVLCMVELLVRGVWPYSSCPWIWARIGDPRIPLASRFALLNVLLKLKRCCSDSGFTERLQSINAGPEQFMPSEPYHMVIDALTIHRVINVKIENNFARAVSQAKASRGRTLSYGSRPLSQHRKLSVFQMPQSKLPYCCQSVVLISAGLLQFHQSW